MNISIAYKEPFQVAGILLENLADNQLIPSLWPKLYSTYSHDDLAKLGKGHPFGVLYKSGTGGINYLAGYDVTDLALADSLKLSHLSIPGGDYAVVTCQGPVPQSIITAWTAIHEEFFPHTTYQHAGTPDLEVYYPGDVTSPDYYMELWIPLVKK